MSRYRTFTIYGEDVKPDFSSVWSSSVLRTPYQNFIVLASGFAQSRQVLRERSGSTGGFSRKKRPETGLVPTTKSLIAS